MKSQPNFKTSGNDGKQLADSCDNSLPSIYPYFGTIIWMSKVFLALLLAMTQVILKRLTDSGTVLKNEKQNSPTAFNKAQQSSPMVLKNKQQIHSQPTAITTAGTHK